jgi:hypothetical protein
MTWHAVRFVYEHERSADGDAVFGETTILFQAADGNELVEKAEAYWIRHVELNPNFKRVGNLVAFTIHGSGAPAEGTEIWCELSETKMTKEAFFQTRYGQFAIEPDESET